MDDLTVGLMPIARTTFDMALAEQMMQQVRDRLAADHHLIAPDNLLTSLEDVQAALPGLEDQPLDLLVILQATFADSSMVMEIARAVDVPLLLWAIPEPRVGGRLRLNSLCGINLAGHALTRGGLTYEYLYAEPNDFVGLEKVRMLAQAGRVRRRLRETRVGRIGEHPAGFDTCAVDVVGLQEATGVEVVQLELASVFEGMQGADRDAVGEITQALGQRVPNLSELDQEATNGTISAYVTLRQLAESQDLGGFAVRCWPEFFTEAGCAACGAMSMMSDEMTPCSCEVDVNGTVTQLMLQGLSGEPAFLTDLVAVEPEYDGLVLWHCGLAPLSMADPSAPVEATIHSNRKLPLLMQFPLKPGVVTVARLSEATGGYRLVIGRAQMVSAPMRFTGTSGVLRFERPARAVLDTIMSEGLEHHLAVTYGDHAEALEALARMLRIPVLHL
ncbi:MAG: L-fucose/L-arabinose isomerase family protein [Anaerolineae bacterium]|nr:L-fucose/L-arabinose isomerase family protein [Anaerolineae bacterium]